MKDLDYQNMAIKDLVSFSKKFLKDRNGALITFQAPTGSGKTIMLAESLSQIVKDITEKDLAFVWISVNYLHEQSKEKLENYFGNEELLECIYIDEIQNNQIDENQILFINWESLNKKGNIFMVDNEKDWNLSKVIDNTKEEGQKIVLIIDESHRNAKTSKSKEIINIISPNLTIEVSATPKEMANDYKVQVNRKDVIDEEMIKAEIQINPNLKKAETNRDIVAAALRRRKQLKKQYEEIDSKINPLLLIQIPRKSLGDVREPEDRILEVLSEHGITTQNEKLAIWLSERDKKINLNYLENNDSDVDVLVFKEAIALGWDCPRASILLLQREWNIDNYIFNIQTLGRIMRMPEHKHYKNNPDLNIGYVYTASDNFSVVEDLAKDYVSKEIMQRDNTVYGDIDLPSEYIRRKREKTRFSGEFRRCLLKVAESNDLKKINTNIVEFSRKIGIDGEILDIDHVQTVDFTKEITILKDKEEVCAEYTKFLRSKTSPFAPTRSTEILKSSVRSLFKRRLEIDDDDTIANIVLNPKNRSEIEQLIDLGKEEYKQLPEKKDTKILNKKWQVPESVSVFDNYETQTDIKKSILKPYSIKKNINGNLIQSKPEKEFITELEKTDDDVLWWWKNGEQESKYFGIAYEKEDNHLYGFYPDFVIKTKENILVIEIKDNKDFRNENILKLNARKSYLKKYNGKEKLYFWIISPMDYFNFFKKLKEPNLDNFSSRYEENLLRNAQSRKIINAKEEKYSKENQELIIEYDKELTKALNEIEDRDIKIGILKMQLVDAKNNLKAVSQYQGNSAQAPQRDLRMQTPFNICVLGEVVDETAMIQELNNYFLKYRVNATDWSIDFFNNIKLRNSNIVSKLKKGQSKYSLVITAQIQHHSGRGNASANLLTELKKEKYVDNIVGCSPKSKLTIDNIMQKIDGYLNI